MIIAIAIHKTHIIDQINLFISHIYGSYFTKSIFIADDILDKLFSKLYYNYQRICIVFEVNQIEKI